MKNSLKDTTTLQFLSSMCDNKSPFEAKLAIISFHNHTYSRIIEAFILFIEYFQLVSQALLFNLTLYDDESVKKDPFTRFIISFCKLLNPGYLLIYEASNNYMKGILIGSLVLIALIIE